MNKRKTKVINTLNNTDDKKILVYFYILKIGQYVILLCICGNYKNFIFPTRVYYFRSFLNNRQFQTCISTVGFRFRSDKKI
jgi:hypothetical protein